MSDLERRILQLSDKYHLGHIGSCLSSVDLIDFIYTKKRKKDIFVLSPGHMALAWYVVLEKYNHIDAEALLIKHGGHPNRDPENGITCSAGSLGLAATVAVGMAIANPKKTVYCLVSDGECAEGSIWETLRFASDKPVKNIKFYVLINGYSATTEIDKGNLIRRLKAFSSRNIKTCFTDSDIRGLCSGIEAHYHILKEGEYEKALQHYPSSVDEGRR